MNIDRIISMVINQVIRRFVGSGVNAAFRYGGSKFGPKPSDQAAPVTPARRPVDEAPVTQRPAAEPAAAPDIEPVTRYSPITDAERTTQLAGEDLGQRARKTVKLGRRMGRF